MWGEGKGGNIFCSPVLQFKAAVYLVFDIGDKVTWPINLNPYRYLLIILTEIHSWLKQNLAAFELLISFSCFGLIVIVL